jgi:hypothetical protein
MYSITGGSDDSLILKVDKLIDMAIWIHNRSLPPSIEYKNNREFTRIFISSNSYTQISVQKIIEVKLPEPYNQCLDDVNKFKLNKSIINYLNRLNQAYSQHKCLELCFDAYYIENNPCNCSNVSIGEVWIKCWNDFEKAKKFSCTWNYKVNFYSKSIAEKCEKYCPVECTTFSYDTRPTTMSNYNSTLMKIFYTTLKYTLITQEPKVQLVDLISNIGGTFGLLIGFSFVTFVEIFEIIIEVILHNLKF